MNKNILIIAVTSQDGAYLSKFLIKKGFKIHGTTRDLNNRNLFNLKKLNIKKFIKLHKIDVSNYNQIFNLIKKIKPTHVYNFAGVNTIKVSIQKPIETYNSILRGNLNIINSMIKFKKIKFFSALSAECFGDNLKNTINENTKMIPTNPYGISKKVIFDLNKNYRNIHKLNVSSGILFNHESGLRSSKYVTTKVVKKAIAIKKNKIKSINLGNIYSYRDWGWAPEYVEAMYMILASNKIEDYIISSGNTLKVIDFVKIAFESLGLDYKKYINVKNQKFRRNDSLFFNANSNKIYNNLNWKAKNDIYSIIDLLIEFHEQN